jgi:hypothetical protein
MTADKFIMVGKAKIPELVAFEKSVLANTKDKNSS